MTARNPLKDEGLRPRSGKVTTEMLHELAQSLNGERFVQAVGRSYFVNRDDQGRHFLDWHNVSRG